MTRDTDLAAASILGNTPDKPEFDSPVLPHIGDAVRILDAIGDGVLTVDLAARVTYLNAAAEKMTGWSLTEANGRPLEVVFALVDAATHAPVANPLIGAMRLQRTMRLTLNCLLIRRDMAELAIEDSAAPVRGPDGQITGAVLVFRDVSAARAVAQKMTHLAQHDFLTDLPNRLLFGDRVGHALALARRNRRSVAVMFLDIDRFKEINDTLGHAVGDQLLQSVARRLVACVRSSDTVCRQGGDEFVILLPEIEQAGDAAIAAQTILLALSESHSIDQLTIAITASIGISIYEKEPCDAEALIRCADIAMYCAKDHGGNAYQFAANVEEIKSESQEFGSKRASCS